MQQQRKLKRKTFDELINQAFDDFLASRPLEDTLKPFEYCPSVTPNRNPRQVPDVLWKELIHRHMSYFNEN
jgi:hypothetical protein